MIVLEIIAWALVILIFLALAFGGHTVRIPRSPRVGKVNIMPIVAKAPEPFEDDRDSPTIKGLAKG